MALCGYRTGLITDPARSNWQQDGARPIAWSAWYPADEPLSIEPPPESFFALGDVALNAPVKETGRLPVVLLSHGTGGTAESLGWLARFLANEGYVVLAANHHGNTGLEPYRAEGFLCWWERAADLSLLLSALDEDSIFKGRLDRDDVSAVGFSLGGYTVLALAGARTFMETFQAWQKGCGIEETGPKEFPDVGNNVPELLKTSDAFRQSWERQSDDYRDQRVRAVVAIAAAPPVRAFSRKSVAEIACPVTLLTGGADQEAPTLHCADWLTAQNSAFKHYDLGDHVGHYTFLEFPSDRSLIGREEIFTDHKSVQRRDIHQRAADLVLRGIARC
ncbi:MAG: alpha/beta fold hydrolase [Pseudomonadota bacterium]